MIDTVVLRTAKSAWIAEPWSVVWLKKKERIRNQEVAKFIEDLRRQLQGRSDLSALIERRLAAKVKAAETAGLQITPDALQGHP